MYDILNWLLVRYRAEFKIQNLVFQALNGLAPSNMIEHLSQDQKIKIIWQKNAPDIQSNLLYWELSYCLIAFNYIKQV